MNCLGCRYGAVCSLPTGLPVVRVSPKGLVEACAQGPLFAFSEEIVRSLGSDRRVLSQRSHTTKVAVELHDTDALDQAVKRLGWQFWQERTVELFDRTTCTGPAVLPPGWRYPIVVQNGQLVFDNYDGVWGNAAHIDTLKGAYALEKARMAAEAEGYDWEEVNGELVIYQPGGTSISVGADGSVQARGFSGSSCTDATRFVESALGATLETLFTDDYYQAPVEVQEYMYGES